MKHGALVFLATWALSAPAMANDTPLSLFLAGEYSQAESTGEAANDAQGLAIAARAALADDQMRDAPCLDCIRRAEDLSRRAIAADPKQPEGHIYLAIAMGYETRIIGDLAAQSKDYANIAKRELDTAFASDPNNPWTLAALGGWHIEIVRGAGSALGRWIFGARLEKGEEYYEKALTIAPQNPVLHYQYALALAGFDLSTYQPDVEKELARTIAQDPKSRFDTFVRARAQQLLDVLKRGDMTEAKRLIRRDRGYPA